MARFSFWNRSKELLAHHALERRDGEQSRDVAEQEAFFQAFRIHFRHRALHRFERGGRQLAVLRELGLGKTAASALLDLALRQLDRELFLQTEDDVEKVDRLGPEVLHQAAV